MSLSFDQPKELKERVPLPVIQEGMAFVPGSDRTYRLYGNEDETFSIPTIPALPPICTALLKSSAVSLEEALQQIDTFVAPTKSKEKISTLLLAEPQSDVFEKRQQQKQEDSIVESAAVCRLPSAVLHTQSNDCGSVNRGYVNRNCSPVDWTRDIINEVWQVLPKPRETMPVEMPIEARRSLRVVFEPEEEPLIIPFVKPETPPKEAETTSPTLKIVAEFNPPTLSSKTFRKCWQSRHKETTLYQKQCLPPVRSQPVSIVQPEVPPEITVISIPKPPVDASTFKWSEQLDSLMQTANNQIRMLTDHLVVQSNQGVKAICFKGVYPGDGCSTLLLCAARALTQRGYRVLLIDTHHINIDLPKQLNLSGNLDSENEVIALDDLLGLWVWQESRTAEENVEFLAKIVASHREEYDLILLDDGSVTECPLAEFVEFWDQVELDGVVLVSNTKRPSEIPVSHIAGRLRQHHIHLVGITENYV